MRQQINLFQPVFRHERQRFSGVTLAASLGMALVVLAGISVYAAHSVATLQQEVTRMTAQQQEQQARLTRAGEMQSHPEQQASLQAQVKALATTLAERTQALQVLQSGAAGQTTGFASRLEALARRHVDGLWIDSLALSGTHNTMRLSGGSVDASTVPVYLRGLSGEAVLSGTRFDDFVIERPEKTADEQVRFHAGSTSLPPKRQPPG